MAQIKGTQSVRKGTATMVNLWLSTVIAFAGAVFGPLYISGDGADDSRPAPPYGNVTYRNTWRDSVRMIWNGGPSTGADVSATLARIQPPSGGEGSRPGSESETRGSPRVGLTASRESRTPMGGSRGPGCCTGQRYDRAKPRRHSTGEHHTTTLTPCRVATRGGRRAQHRADNGTRR